MRMSRHQIPTRITWQFQIGDSVYYNHGGEAFMIEAQRYTRSASMQDRIEYFLDAGIGNVHFWADEDRLTLAEKE